MNIPENDQPEFSNGWLQAFQERHNFHHFKLHGESGSADLQYAIDRDEAEEKDIYKVDQLQ
ncbi:3794_t:CDS:2, partial [Dentiscutata heterogama]